MEEEFRGEKKERKAPGRKPAPGGDVDVVALLSYLGLLCLVPLMARKEDRFVQFHAKQGLVLFIGEMGTMVFTWIPYIGWFFGMFLWIAWAGLSVMGILNVVREKRKKLPVVGGLAEKIEI